MCKARVRNEGRESGSQQCPGHLGIGKEQQTSSSKRVDRREGGPGEDEIDQAKTKNCHQGGELVGTCLTENGATIEGDNVNATHLLGDHDRPGGKAGATYARNSEKLGEATDIVRLANNFLLNQNLSIDVVEIASCLDRVLAQAEERVVGVAEAPLLDIPARRF